APASTKLTPTASKCHSFRPLICPTVLTTPSPLTNFTTLTTPSPISPPSVCLPHYL
ncbi:hypothetical protein Pcinc_030658, partial [Petrolisthes cinctipes]